MKADILIVDDELPNLKVLSNILTEEGYSVRTAPNGQTALTTINVEPPELILLDIRMPGIDGFEVCRRLKQDEKTASIPVIFITALDDLNSKVKGFQIGGVDYITKPFYPDEVMARVNTHVKLYRLQNRLKLLVNDKTKSLEIAGMELEKAKFAAEAGKRAKSEFLSNISHEFRTPLNVIIGWTEFLVTSTDIALDYREWLKQVLESSLDLLKKVEDLIELVHIQSDGVKPENIPFSLNTVMKNNNEHIMPFVKNKRLTMETVIEPDVPDNLVGDPKILEKILLKITENAVKYTEKGGIKIFVTNQSIENLNAICLLFSIIDTGIGIPADRLDKIFEDFVLGDSSNSRKYGGMGVGLSLARRLIKLLGGKISVECREKGGTGFYILLPFGQPADTTTHPPPPKGGNEGE